jgi:hypothetical protein
LKLFIKLVVIESMRYFILLFLGLSSCASLYHVQVADVEASDRGRMIEVMVSETAFDFKAVGQTGLGIAKRNAIRRGDSRATDQIQGAELILALTNYGPRTGLPVFTDRYSDYVLDELISKCPTGRITGITSIREARQYPFISGEIVNIRGFCAE